VGAVGSGAALFFSHKTAEQTAGVPERIACLAGGALFQIRRRPPVCEGDGANLPERGSMEKKLSSFQQFFFPSN